MYQFWRNNKNVVLVAVSLFFISATSLLFFLSDEDLSADLKADVINAHETESSHGEEGFSLEDFSNLGEGPIIVLGLDGIIEDATYEYEKITNYHIEEIKDKLFFSLIHPDDLSGILAAYSKVLTSEEPEPIVGPFRIKNALGDYQIHMASLEPLVQDENLVGVAVSSLDISDSLELEIEAIEEEKQAKEESHFEKEVETDHEYEEIGYEEYEEEDEELAIEEYVIEENEDKQEENTEKPTYNKVVKNYNSGGNKENASMKSATLATDESQESNDQEEEAESPTPILEHKIAPKSENKSVPEKKSASKAKNKSQPKVEKKNRTQTEEKSKDKNSDKRHLVQR